MQKNHTTHPELGWAEKRQRNARLSHTIPYQVPILSPPTPLAPVPYLKYESQKSWLFLVLCLFFCNVLCHHKSRCFAWTVDARGMNKGTEKRRKVRGRGDWREIYKVWSQHGGVETSLRYAAFAPLVDPGDLARGFTASGQYFPIFRNGKVRYVGSRQG